MVKKGLVALALTITIPSFAQSRPVSMEELAAAFSSNPIAAKRQFSDFLVRGSVTSISEGKTPGSALVHFIKIDKSQPSYKLAYFIEVRTTEDDAAGLSKGNQATFRCKSSHKEKEIGLNLTLEGCRVVL
jgi:hypothetical protein